MFGRRPRRVVQRIMRTIDIPRLMTPESQCPVQLPAAEGNGEQAEDEPEPGKLSQSPKEVAKL